jgi:outer membrane protein, adhesin transport system
MLKKLAPALLAVLCYSPSEAAPWAFEQVLQSALRSHPQVLGKQAALAAAVQEREGAQWQRYPTPSVEASSQSGGTGVLRLEQPLWTGGRISAGIDAADSRAKVAQWTVLEMRQELALKVVAASTEALRQQARQNHTMQGVNDHERLLAMMRRRVAQEVSPEADERMAQARLYSAASDLSFATQALNNALAQLTQLAGEPVTAMAMISLSEVSAPARLEDALAKALESSPVLQRMAQEEQTAEADIAAKRAAYFPQLLLRLEHSEAGAFKDDRAMLVLLAQPGAGLSAQSGVQAAVARREAAYLARQQAERDLRERMALDWNDWLASRQRLQNATLARAMSSEVSESYARQFTIGRKTWIDVLNAVRETVQSELAIDDAQAQMVAASLRLRVLTHTLTTLTPDSLP